MSIIYAISILTGTIIGVGIFSLPYITLKVGFWVMIGYFLVLGFLVMMIHQFFGELALKTPDLKRIPGFAKYHLGDWGEKFAWLTSILGLSGAILAYLIVGGEFLSELFFPFFGGDNLIWTFVYFLLGAVFILFGTKLISKVEFWGLILFFALLILIFLKAKGIIHFDNLFIKNQKFGIEEFFLPYGPVLFSLWGASLIPEVEEMLRDKKHLLSLVIYISILIPIFVYLFFIYLILGISGAQTTESALVGLREFLGTDFVTFLLFFGFLNTFTSFISLGLTLKKIYWYDLKLEKNLAFFLTIFPPFVLFLLGIKKFLSLISFVGSVMIGLEGILILLMCQKIQQSKIKKFLNYFCFVVLACGILYYIFYFLK
jgi:tyrosine-specific transport protein